MSVLSQIFGFATKVADKEIPEIFPMPIVQTEFVTTDVMTIYSKILTDVLERTHGLKDEQVQLMWDNCVKSSQSDGLISMLAKAMADKADLYIVYDKAVGVIRKATSQEQATITADYEKKADSATGVFISFKNYRRSDMVKLYSALSYSTIAALNKNLNVSASVQFKISDLRASVSLTDSVKAEAQGSAIAKAMLESKPVLLDAKDIVELASPDLSATEKSIEFIANKLAFYLGMPSSYITGDQTAGIGSTGENDMRAVERGLKNYFFSIMKPAVEAIFATKVTYKSQDFRNISGALEVLKTFALTDEEFISAENKLKIINAAFDLPEDAEGDPVAKVDPAAQLGPDGKPLTPGVKKKESAPQVNAD